MTVYAIYTFDPMASNMGRTVLMGVTLTWEEARGVVRALRQRGYTSPRVIETRVLTEAEVVAGGPATWGPAT